MLFLVNKNKLISAEEVVNYNVVYYRHVLSRHI